jgi:hypothetical protein
MKTGAKSWSIERDGYVIEGEFCSKRCQRKATKRLETAIQQRYGDGNTISTDGIGMDDTAIAEVIRQSREQGKAERMLFTIHTPNGNEVQVTFQPTYDAAAHVITLTDPITIDSTGSEYGIHKAQASFEPITLNLDENPAFPRSES